MLKIAMILSAAIGLLHTYIAWVEIFAWETRGPNIFTSFPAELFPQTVDMAANQGIYNAFLAAGLFWALVINDVEWKRKIAACFLIFVAVAGVFGAITVTNRTFFIQTVPAVIALLLLFLDYRKTQRG